MVGTRRANSIYIPSPQPLVNSNHSLGQGMVGGWVVNDARGKVIDVVAGEMNAISSFGTGSSIAPAVAPYYRTLTFDNTTNGWASAGVKNRLKPILPLSIVVAVKLTTLSQTNIVHGDTNGGVQTNTSGYVLGCNSASGDITTGYGDNTAITSAGIRQKVTSTGILTANVWYHIVVVLKGATDIQIYVNGRDVGGTYSGTGTGLVYAGREFRLSDYNVPAILGINGQIAHCYIYNKALTADQAMWLYQQPYAMLIQHKPRLILNSATSNTPNSLMMMGFGI